MRPPVVGHVLWRDVVVSFTFELFPRHSKHLFQLGINGNELAITVLEENSGRGTIDNVTKEMLALLQCLLSTLALGDFPSVNTGNTTLRNKVNGFSKNPVLDHYLLANSEFTY